MIVELHAILKGKVQGVGFRWTIVDHAEKFNLTGTVQNLKDGSVEIFAQGTQEALEEFVDAVQGDTGHAEIDSFQSEYKNTENTYQGFRILHKS